MTTLTWHGKEDAVRKAQKTPYYLLREVPKFSHNIGDSSTARQLDSSTARQLDSFSLAKIMLMSMKILSFKAII